MDEEERKRIVAELEAKKKELDTLKAKLSELNAEKEAWFEKKRRATDNISEIIRSIRDAKGKRNTFTKQVKDSKQRRQELNKLLKDKMDELRKVQDEKNQITKRLGIRVDPSKIQEEIEQLEFKIETEALPFNIEQQMMRRIAEKKKFLEQAREVSDVFEKAHNIRKELDRIRKKADDTHRKVQSKAEASQQFHEELVESSNDIKDLRKKEEDALKSFVEAKKKYTDQNSLVKAKLDEISELRAKLDGINLAERKKAKKEEEKKLIEQERNVEEKIKKGMKLTTEDLLAFQAKENMSQKQDRQKGRGKKQK
ncbi:TPA: hypothetical protein HA265_08090 [Candidatus Woesearchaeota archaeon]|nr:hypothetical protein [Candidatus Woesearchaeota archaeon]